MSIFKERTRFLKEAVVKLGGYVFYKVENYRIRSVYRTLDGDELDGSENGKKVLIRIEEITGLIQIDAPQTQAEELWNKTARNWENAHLIEEHNASDGHTFETDDISSTYVDMKLISASGEVIVTSIDASNYSYPEPHPHGHTYSENWSLSLGRLLNPGDIFDNKKPWAKKLLPVAQANLKCLGQCVDDAKLTTIDEISRWRLTPDGLYLNYGNYELGGYASYGHSVIPWADIKPFLRQDLPFNPELLQAPLDGHVDQ